MIYGNASLLDVPWEIIIKTCRDKIGSNKYKHLEEYGDHFIDYIKQSNFFSEKSQETWVESNVIGYYTGIREELFNHFKLQKKQLTESEIYAHFKTIITKHHTDLNSLKLIPNSDNNFEKNLKTKHTEIFDKVFNHVFQNLAIKNQKMKN